MKTEKFAKKKKKKKKMKNKTRIINRGFLNLF